MSNLNPQRRARIIEAALELFLADGMRGTSMEAIARAAQVAKPTLYKYFPDKQAVFEAIVEGLIGDLRSVAEQALAQDGTAAQRAAAALSAKHKMVYRLLENSPHAAELYSAPLGRNKDVLKALEVWLLGEIEKLFAEEGRTDSRALAHLLHASADGIARHAHQAGEIGPAIRLLAEKLTA